MTPAQSAAIWDIILTAAERDERVREALRASLPVPTGAADRGWPTIQQSISPEPNEGNATSLHSSVAIVGSAGSHSETDRATSPYPAVAHSGGWGRGDR